MSKIQDMKASWEANKPRIVALAVGLVAGPIITSMAGWQVTGGTAREMLRAGVIEQQAIFCEQRARADVKEPGKLEWAARNDLAKKWSVMPGAAAVDSDVTFACARKLAA